MSNYTCEYARALVERGMEGGYQFLDAMIGVDACSMMNRAMEHFEILQMNDKPNFFVSHCDIPYKVTDYTLDSYVRQMSRCPRWRLWRGRRAYEKVQQRRDTADRLAREFHADGIIYEQMKYRFSACFFQSMLFRARKNWGLGNFFFSAISGHLRSCGAF